SAALPDPSPPAAPPANACFKPYTVGTTPTDLATTTTTHGLTVPYIVRVERGTLNRGIYDIAVLFDPAKPWSALAPQAQSNGNGCTGGSIQQNTVASTSPGLLDGIQPSCYYPDSITTGLEVIDCVLLVNFYAGSDWTALMAGKMQAQVNAKKAAINGHLDQRG